MGAKNKGGVHPGVLAKSGEAIEKMRDVFSLFAKNGEECREREALAAWAPPSL